ncbi:MAG: Aspartyl/glutamyl-tRNA(Asn/Gln) amidotransferase subunit B [Candidatus Magasanikbacteria bacterium GW2011_GWC2_34_16]|uniref:Aspartyl/glutamyl-tRNA(Asn/Gln) amidotransferase subunit B n=2 Tax=Candidatus Magasanikiibacteriota TaxID=1752731 RepID=A0A0G0HR64_9BACT|nr:MAG: Aspartyl/glutamyl-tRNA(Asn/Gln) amidotransferase subunit B [Candidatus Magasanikbacteria bacterium GW2011_GWC2_34_16]KKQ41085.1 MAG: Aspartyl/glutamyl-tRNA(Asn/Gln) amidotransferase subunit B [Candidatus Magasanikbacteria bacterium GW2011_GWA2_37_8]
MPNLIPIIGLEIHVELKTKSKMFCSCKNDPDHDAPNTNICEICLAHPGTLPVPNKTAIEWTVKIAQALGCKINTESKFDRKHYFYPDLPKGYQISQYDQPVGEHGKIELDFLPGKNHRDNTTIGITRVHLEEDTAKLTHGTKNETLVDFNRAGVPLVEIVSDPDIESGTEAKAYCQELQAIFRSLGVSDADMEKGQMRCEANISLQEAGQFVIEDCIVKPAKNYTLNPKVEVKNINSFRAVEKAIDFEIARQTKMLENGETWIQQTRGWDNDKNETVLQREKETSADYRYFPEPDIPPFNPSQIAGEINLPELPAAKRKRFHTEYGFSYADAGLLSNDKNWGDFAESTISEMYDWLHNLPETKANAEDTIATQKTQLAKLAGGWITSKLMGAMSERKIDIKILKIKPENFAELIALIFTNRVNSTNAQKILIEMLDSGVDMDPTHIMEEKGYGQMADEDALGKIVDEVIKNNPNQVTQFKAGKEPLLQFLKGMVMKATEGSADPGVAEKLLREKLKN